MKHITLLMTFCCCWTTMIRAAESDKVESSTPRRPNILFVIADDMSAQHSGAYGDNGLQTPAIDRLAREGVRFTRAFCAAPSCTPSRSAILTGQMPWRLEEAGLLMGGFPPKFAVYPRMLEDAGYHVGYTGKGWGPGNWQASGRKKDPVGQPYNQVRLDAKSMNMPEYFAIDYATNFEKFMSAKPANAPFAFWCGFVQPHLPWRKGLGSAQGKKPQDATFPRSLPDTELVRNDVLDYYAEIEYLDQHLGRILKTLEAVGELDNTLILFTSDHGFALPRSKCNLYDSGTNVPLIARYPQWIKPGRVVDDIVSLTDIAPTVLTTAGLAVPTEMTGRSLLPQLQSDKSGQIDPKRDFVATYLERHTWTRPNGLGYPMRALRTAEYLYIRNYEPTRWPAGDPNMDADPQGFFGDIDKSETKTMYLKEQANPAIAPFLHYATAQRPAEELYQVSQDPDQLTNLANDPAFAKTKQLLRQQLEQYQTQTGDPRVQGLTPWDSYPYFYKGVRKTTD